MVVTEFFEILFLILRPDRPVLFLEKKAAKIGNSSRTSVFFEISLVFSEMNAHHKTCMNLAAV